MINSRDKGARGERELAKKLKEYGYGCRRGQQYSGANGDADVVGLDGIHIECKRVEKLNLYDAMAQAEADVRGGELPVVMHRKNACEWLVTMTLEQWIELYREWQPGDRLIDRWLSSERERAYQEVCPLEIPWIERLLKENGTDTEIECDADCRKCWQMEAGR